MRRSTRKACTAVLALAVIAPVAHADPLVAPTRSVGHPGVVRMPTLESGLLAAINALRAQHGLRPLRFSARLRAAAAVHSADMARRGYFDHGLFWRRIERFYPDRRWRDWSVGENIAYGSPSLTVLEALEMWLASPPHRRNLFSRSWRDGGIGVVYADPAPGVFGGMPTTIVTLDVGQRLR